MEQSKKRILWIDDEIELLNRILWIDDEIELLKPHIILLNQRGYDVETATNGEDAIELASNTSYDLVFLDESKCRPPPEKKESYIRKRIDCVKGAESWRGMGRYAPSRFKSDPSRPLGCPNCPRRL